MDYANALKILDIEDSSDKSSLKKKYRQLMHMVHPDNTEFKSEAYPYDAATINAAYSFLCDYKKVTVAKTKNTKGTNAWDAPVNASAYCNRPIFDDITDMDGEVIGKIVIAEGKYLWSKDEEFHLFIKSIFETSKEMLSDIDISLDRKAPAKNALYHAELVYLLSGQFIDGTKALYDLHLDIDETENDTTFYIPAMLETDIQTNVEGDVLYPSRLRDHRLYVTDKTREIVGYISFKDDKLSFIITPLLMQHNVSMKFRLASSNVMSTKRRELKSHPVDMWLKIGLHNDINYVSDVNSKIESLLESYKNI